MWALFGTTKSTKYLIVRAVFSKMVWWVKPQFSPTLLSPLIWGLVAFLNLVETFAFGVKRA